MRKRVLEVVYGFDYGGIRAFIMNCLEHIDRNEFAIDIYAFGTSGSPFKEKVGELGGNIYFESENNVRNIPHFVSQLKKIMKDKGPYDVCHAHCNLISAWVLLAAKICGIPVRIAHSHTCLHFSDSMIQNIYSYFRRFVIRNCATDFLACGQKAGEEMYGKGNPFVVVNNGIDIENFYHLNNKKLEHLRCSLKIPKDARVYANISRLDSNKNHAFIIDVFEKIAEMESNAYLLIGGSDTLIDSSRSVVEQKISKSRFQDRIILIGAQTDMSAIYHLSDCWIYASKFEGLPFGPIELQAACIPCVASDTITREIDLGMNLITFLSLKDSAEKWAKTAMCQCKKEISFHTVNSAFCEHNFSIKQSVKILEGIYIKHKDENNEG